MMEVRAIAMLLVMLQAGVVGRMFGSWPVPALAGLAVVVGVWGRWRLDLSRAGKLFGALAILAAALLEWWLLRPEGPGPTLVLRNHVGHTFAKCLLLIQAAMFFVRWPGELPIGLPLCGVAVMTCAGDMVARGAARQIYLGAALGFVGLAAAFLYQAKSRAYVGRVPRRLRYQIGSMAVIALALMGADATGVAMYRHRDQIDGLFIGLLLRQLIPESMGLGDDPKLGSVAELRATDSNAVALRIASVEPPGYVRGRAYDGFEASQWLARTKLQPIDPADPAHGGGPPVTQDESLFLLDAPARPGWPHWQIFPTVFDRGAVFCPLRPSAVVAACGQISRDGADSLKFTMPKTAEIYNVYLSAPGPRKRQRLPAQDRERLTQAPEGLDPRVRQLADAVFKGCTTTGAKTLAVVDYFRRHYQYRFGISVPAGRDPITYFLLERPAAHCEYFATGAALLLRLGGIPCRYVTGFVATERNPLGQHWIARNRDAHAWVEAYDDDLGWFTVEPTVPDGLPDADRSKRTGWLGYLWDWMRFGHEQRRAAYALGGIKAVCKRVLSQAWAVVRQAVRSVPGMLAAACAVGWALWSVLRRWSTRLPRRRAPRTGLQRLLDRMERRLARRGITRRDAETLHQFASRLRHEHKDDPGLRAIADWCMEYAVGRYSGAPEADTTVALEARLRQCLASAAQRPPVADPGVRA